MRPVSDWVRRIVPWAWPTTSRTARLVEEGGVLVATGETTIDDEIVLRLLDGWRR